MLRRFNDVYSDVPTAWIDVETTGIRPGYDRAVQVGIARFERGRIVEAYESLVYPGIRIPKEATDIHGITDEMVNGMPSISEVWSRPSVQNLVSGAQPAAYNGPFDRHFVPPFGDDWTWPWIDCLSLVRVVDRFSRGNGRHKLANACARHGVELVGAHGARADATAAGTLFYRLMSGIIAEEFGDELQSEFGPRPTIGELLYWQRLAEAHEWQRFTSWLSTQPARA